jgi:hypothetical protein
MSQPQSALVLLLNDIDPKRPTGRDASGRPYFDVRARVPFTFDAGILRDAVVRPHTSTGAPVDTRTQGEGGAAPEARAADDGRDGPAAGPRIRGPRIEGVASSTGRDSYGTEMSRECLDGMAAQFRAGTVVYLAKHPSYFAGDGEWDDVMGFVYDGTVERAHVPSAAEPEEQGYLLRVGVQLDEKHAKTASLAEKVADGHLIGQSIGGWFTKMRFVWPEGTDEDEKFWSVEPERIIIEEVDLDHLAATRRPANCESWLDGVRSALHSHQERRRAMPGTGENKHPRAHIDGEQGRTGVRRLTDEEVARLRGTEPAVEPAPVATAEVPVPAPEPTVEHSEASEAPALDTSASASNDTDEPTSGSDAQEALPQEQAIALSQEPPMSPEQIAALAAAVSESVRSALAADRAANAAPAPVVVAPVVEAAPAARAEDPEVIALRAQVASLRTDLAGALAEPVRRGVVGHFSLHRSGAESEANALLATLDTETRGRRLGAVMRSRGFIDRRSAAPNPAVPDAFNDTLASLPSKDSLRSDLFAVIGAGCDDALIRVPDTSTSWA